MNNNEPIILGKVKKGKTGKPILGLIIFLFIGAFLLYLPTIISYFGDYSIVDLVKEGQIVDFIKNHDSYVNKNITESKKEETIVSKSLLNTKTSIKYNTITLSKFLLSKDSLEYDIASSKEIDLDNEQLFLVLIQNDKEIVKIKLEGTIKDKQTIKFNFINDLNSILNVYGEVKVIKQSDYPEFTLKSDESGITGLTCTNSNDEIEYLFNLNKLINIKETFNYIESNNEKYLSKFEEYTKIKEKILNSNNTSELIENNDGFVFNSSVDLSKFDETINNYYKLNTDVKIINFEMTSKGYDCK